MRFKKASNELSKEALAKLSAIEKQVLTLEKYLVFMFMSV
jgi:hypothetical protein